MRALLVLICLLPMVSMARVSPRAEGSVKLTAQTNTADMIVIIGYHVSTKKFGFDNDSSVSYVEKKTHVENDGTFIVPSVDLGTSFRRSQLVTVTVSQEIADGKTIIEAKRNFSNNEIDSMGSSLKNLDLKETKIIVIPGVF